MSKQSNEPGLNMSLGSTIILAAWVGGWVLAQGWKAMAAAILFPPYAWYLTAEKFMEFFGMIGQL